MNKDRYFKYPEIPHLASAISILDGDVQVFEKLDGGNTQLRRVNYRVLCGSRAHYLTDKNSLRVVWFPKFLHWAMANRSLVNLPEEVVVFGEWLAKHTLDYDERNRDRFYLLDILNLNSGRFMEYQEAADLVKKHGLEDIHILPVLARGKVSLSQLRELVKKSDYRDGISEGVVVKDYPNQRFAKLWTKNLGKPEELYSKYMEQAYFSILDSGRKLSRSSLFDEIRRNLEGQQVHYSSQVLFSFVDKNYSSLIDRLK